MIIYAVSYHKFIFEIGEKWKTNSDKREKKTWLTFSNKLCSKSMRTSNHGKCMPILCLSVCLLFFFQSIYLFPIKHTAQHTKLCTKIQYNISIARSCSFFPKKKLFFVLSFALQQRQTEKKNTTNAQ